MGLGEVGALCPIHKFRDHTRVREGRKKGHRRIERVKRREVKRGGKHRSEAFFPRTKRTGGKGGGPERRSNRVFVIRLLGGSLNRQEANNKWPPMR